MVLALTVMVGRVKMGWLSVVVLTCLFALPSLVRAAPGQSKFRPGDRFDYKEALDPASHWMVGVTLDYANGFGRQLEKNLETEQLAGVTATYRRSRFGINSKLLITPQSITPRARARAVLGPRILFEAFDRNWDYGVSVQGDAILDDHHWILYVSPIELGFDLYQKDSFHVRLFGGVRYALRGDLLTNFLIDPNGFPHVEFEQILDDKLDHPWEGTVHLVFVRRID
jgi:hypothetical protein